MLSVAAVLTNAGLITFTMDVLDRYSTTTRFWVFVAFQWACFALQVNNGTAFNTMISTSCVDD